MIPTIYYDLHVQNLYRLKIMWLRGFSLDQESHFFEPPFMWGLGPFIRNIKRIHLRNRDYDDKYGSSIG